MHFLIVILFFFDAFPPVEEGNYQGLLTEHLVNTYGEGIVRPVFNHSTITTVIFRPKIHEVIELVRNCDPAPLNEAL